MNIRQYEDTIILTNVTDDESTKIYRLVQGKSEKVLPRPVIRDGNGKFTKNYSPRDWFLKLQEEVFEAKVNAAMCSSDKIRQYFHADENGIAEEIADVITVCISYLNALGYDEKKRSEIFRRVNEKNEKRGYFKETD